MLDFSKREKMMKRKLDLKHVFYPVTGGGMRASSKTKGKSECALQGVNRYLFTHVHSSIIHNSQKMKTTQVSTNRRTDKQNMVYPYNGMICSL